MSPLLPPSVSRVSEPLSKRVVVYLQLRDLTKEQQRTEDLHGSHWRSWSMLLCSHLRCVMLCYMWLCSHLRCVLCYVLCYNVTSPEVCVMHYVMFCYCVESPEVCVMLCYYVECVYVCTVPVLWQCLLHVSHTGPCVWYLTESHHTGLPARWNSSTIYKGCLVVHVSGLKEHATVCPYWTSELLPWS